MPLGSNVATARVVVSLHRLTIENHSKFNISKASRWILIKLHTQHDWAVGKVAYCFWISGCHGNIYVLMGKKSSSLKPQGP